MYPYIHIVLPSYTVMALVGGFAALCLVYFRLGKYGIEFTFFLKMFFLCIIGGVIGSKVLFAATRIPWLVQNFTVKNLLLLIPQSGFVFYGGLFGVIFTIAFITGKDRDIREKLFRLCVPAMPLFHAVGRLGCFLTGCCYGKELRTPVTIGPFAFTNIPVQLFEALAEFVLFAVICVIDRRREEVNLLRIYLLSYAVIRFADEFFRGDEIRGIYFGMSTAQWISLAILFFYFVQSVQDKTKIKAWKS